MVHEFLKHAGVTYNFFSLLSTIFILTVLVSKSAIVLVDKVRKKGRRRDSSFLYSLHLARICEVCTRLFIYLFFHKVALCLA